MITGLIRGAIAASWMKPAEGLKPPNNFVPAVEIEKVYPYVTHVDIATARTDMNANILMNTASDGAVLTGNITVLIEVG